MKIAKPLILKNKRRVAAVSVLLILAWLIAGRAFRANGENPWSIAASDSISSKPSAIETDKKRVPSLSRLPIDVLRDYSYNGVHLLNGAGAPLYGADERYSVMLKRLRESPPDVLIVGKEAPLTHSLGPILSFGGENRTFPLVSNRKDDDPRRQLSPAEFALRIKATERFVQDAHAAGVRTVIPYISPMTMYGKAETRQGFFQFFDSWNKYQSDFDLGSRPAGDPIDWTQRDKNGKTYFRVGGGSEDVAGMIRYSMCVNNPSWRRWQMLVADWAARVGYDGVWMDNVLVHRCYDEYCQAVAKDLGTDLNREPDRVWLESYLRYFDDLRTTGGARRHNSFYLGGNYIELPFQRAVGDKLDLTMIEQVWLGAARILWRGGIWTGYYSTMPRQPVAANPRGIGDGHALNNIWIAQLSYAMRGERGGFFLAGAAGGKGAEFAHNEDSAVLALAEAATFGGGAAVQVVGQYPLHSDNDLPAHRARKLFYNFARTHQNLYEGMLPAGNIALVVFPDQQAAALVEAQQVHEALLWRGLLVDVLDGDKQTSDTLGRYNLIIVPGRPVLPKWMNDLPLLRSADPLTPEEVTQLKKSYQKDRSANQIRQTKLADAALERARALTTLVLPQGSLVEASAWANDSRLVLHLMDFRVPIGLDNIGKAATQAEFPAQLKLPANKSVKSVTAYSLTAPSRSLRFEQHGNVAKFHVASWRVYEILEITFK